MSALPQARVLDLTFGMGFHPMIGWIYMAGFVAIGSLNTQCNNLPVARIPDLVLALALQAIIPGFIVTGSRTVRTNNTNNARQTDFFVGLYIGIIILGSPNKITG